MSGETPTQNRPLISVIVPVYKVEQYLDECVTSIVNQTYRNLDIILVDDGSPDDCPAMCDAWARKDARIQVVHKANGGLSSARNAGLDVARGSRIAFVDSDDWVDDTMLATMNAWMDARPHADVVMCGTIKRFEDGRTDHIDAQVPERTFTSDEALHDFLYHRNRMASAVWNKLFDARLFDQEGGIRFPEGLNSEDYYLLAHIYRVMRGLYFNPQGLYQYRIREDSITTARVNAHSLDKAIGAEEYCDYLERNGYADREALAYGRMQGWYDVLYDILGKDADAAMIRRCRISLSKHVKLVLGDRSLPLSRKIKIMLLSVSPRIYYWISKRNLS
ncbi:glycosyltransferase family 2 protein [Bifidobacterium samirii]|uniref:Glycosyl transferase family 2 n=1 Tax=Bifidobacterium samirii TaxID=2306974 RepID=A0A430FR62_9BIFI|nr:glycosyltransferase family 2 protein [Bifidobacterium samirii]RSX55316.1 glycosyl transferase family 2 [Bifidobacterium samirii]